MLLTSLNELYKVVSTSAYTYSIFSHLLKQYSKEVIFGIITVFKLKLHIKDPVAMNSALSSST